MTAPSVPPRRPTGGLQRLDDRQRARAMAHTDRLRKDGWNVRSQVQRLIDLTSPTTLAG
jgi:hypothetical protein